MTKKPRAPWKSNYGHPKWKKSFEKQWPCCKKVWLSLKTTSAFKKGLQIPRKKLPQHCLTKCLKPKRPTFSLKTPFLTIKNQWVFIEKRSWMTKTPRASWKINYGHPKLKSPFKNNDLAAKTYDSLWKRSLLLKRPANSKEKTPTALSYKMLEAKKTNTSHWKIKQI